MGMQMILYMAQRRHSIGSAPSSLPLRELLPTAASPQSEQTGKTGEALGGGQRTEGGVDREGIRGESGGRGRSTI